jgi:hypothetical protein
MAKKEVIDIPPPVSPIAEYHPIIANLAILKRDYTDFQVDTTTPDGRALGKAVVKKFNECISTLEEERVRVKAPALKRCRDIDEEAKKYDAELRGLREPIRLQNKAYDDAVAKERQDKIDAENLCRTTIQGKIQRFRMVAGAMVNKTSAEILEVHEKVSQAVIDQENYMEFLEEAGSAREEARGALNALFLEVQEREAEQTRIQLERVELEELRTNQAAMQKQIDDANAAEVKRLADEKAAHENKLRLEREAHEMGIARENAVREDAIRKETEQREAERTRQFQQNEAERTKREEEQRQIKIREEAVAEQERLNKEREAAQAERVKDLLRAKKDTPVAALVETIRICHDDGASPQFKLHAIELVAEASLPPAEKVVDVPVKAKRTTKTKI